MNEIRTTIGRGGRLNIPAEHRKALGLSEGDEVLVGVEGGAITIQTREAAIDRVQRMVRQRVGAADELDELHGSDQAPGRRLSDELISERREEAAKDE